ncbi:hypothetical protein I4F81_002367 [Pyropia yezoensis]|uniref:Uncharacterized protein n=1 Tax=Pyropia yezoensis TaxID=2788 RepID=A0ACC3BQA9_PYRYE|nr:hypothetical protein I4F81_002367 [Neopyropia yezoensis]
MDADPLFHPAAGTFGGPLSSWAENGGGDSDDSCSEDVTVGFCVPHAGGYSRGDSSESKDRPDASGGSPLPSSAYPEVAAWLASQFHTSGDDGGDRTRRVVILEAATVARRLALYRRGGTPSTTSALSPRELTETDRVRLCGALVAHALRIQPVVDENVALSAGVNGLQPGPLVRLSHRPPVVFGSTDASRHELPARPSQSAIQLAENGGGSIYPSRHADAEPTTASAEPSSLHPVQPLLPGQAPAPVADVNDAPMMQNVEIRVRVAASVVADSDPIGPLTCSLRIAAVGLTVDGQLAVVDRRFRRASRVVGYFMDRLSVRLAAVPPPDRQVVVESVGGRGGFSASVGGISTITHGIAESRGRTVGATVGIGGEGGPIPSLSMTGEQSKNRTNEVSAETAQPAWEWTGNIRRRETAGDPVAARAALGNAPFPTYVEWTWSLVCWSTGMPYNAAEIFRKDVGSWPRLATSLAVPAQLNGVAELCTRMVIYNPADAPWSPQSASDGMEGAVGRGGWHPPHGDAPAGGLDALPRLSARRARGHLAAHLAPLLGAGLELAPPLPLLAFSPALLAVPPAPSALSAPSAPPRRRRRWRQRKRLVTFVVELAPSLVLHRQRFRRIRSEHVESERWPPVGSAPDVGVQRFRFRVEVKEGQRT